MSSITHMEQNSIKICSKYVNFFQEMQPKYHLHMSAIFLHAVTFLLATRGSQIIPTFNAQGKQRSDCYTFLTWHLWCLGYQTVNDKAGVAGRIGLSKYKLGDSLPTVNYGKVAMHYGLILPVGISMAFPKASATVSYIDHAAGTCPTIGAVQRDCERV